MTCQIGRTCVPEPPMPRAVSAPRILCASYAMAGASPLYYWDTCLFLAWLNDERRKTGEMDGVREVIARHKRREVRIVTSVLTRIEVLESKIPVGVGNSFTDLLKRMTQMGMDAKVAGLHTIFAITILRTQRPMGERFSPRPMRSI